MTSSSIEGQRPAVLIVEDEALIRVHLALEFEAAGMEVHQAGTGQEALDLLERGLQLSCVITDLRMQARSMGAA
jgi:CheY-like chemotaxis protein